MNIFLSLSLDSLCANYVLFVDKRSVLLYISVYMKYYFVVTYSINSMVKRENGIMGIKIPKILSFRVFNEKWNSIFSGIKISFRNGLFSM